MATLMPAIPPPITSALFIKAVAPWKPPFANALLSLSAAAAAGEVAVIYEAAHRPYNRFPQCEILMKMSPAIVSEDSPEGREPTISLAILL
jgi:hypothetical protein